MLETLDDWTLSLDNSKCVNVAYFDFSKAFDTIPHHRLIAKLKSWGISGSLLSLIESFLVGRTFKTVVNGYYSEERPVISGTPQGTILGPLLFIAYISDISSFCAIEGVTLKLYADDLKAYVTHSNETAEMEKLKTLLTNFQTIQLSTVLNCSLQNVLLYILGAKTANTLTWLMDPNSWKGKMSVT